MLDLIEEYSSEIIIIAAMTVARVFGRQKTAEELKERLKQKREKRIQKQEHKLEKRVNKAKKDAEVLEKLKKENENA